VHDAKRCAHHTLCVGEVDPIKGPTPRELNMLLLTDQCLEQGDNGWQAADLPLIVYVEGNIAAGKSTLLKALSDSKTSATEKVVPEPVGLWESSGLLRAMYEGKLALGAFELFTAATRGASLLEALAGRHQTQALFCERSIRTSFEVFGKTYMHDNLELKALEASVDALERALSPHSAVTVWIAVPLHMLAERCAQRARPAEGAMDVERVQTLLELAYSRYHVTSSARQLTYSIDGEQPTAILHNQLRLILAWHMDGRASVLPICTTRDQCGRWIVPCKTNHLTPITTAGAPTRDGDGET
jgi:deoxyadenosine/deoxycytidine kinase